MKTVKYHCNVCREEKNTNDIHNFYWRQKWEMNKSVDKSDIHICNDCIRIIKEYKP